MKGFFKTQIFSDAEETANRFATNLLNYCREVSSQQNIYIALSGGNTPRILFNILANLHNESPDWRHLHFFWVDERCVPFSSDESNFGVADRLLFSRVSIPRENLHPIIGDNDPVIESARYAQEIKTVVPFAGGFPVFDIIILGMGDDGHTASIFPGIDILPEALSICGVSSHPKTGQKRITMTYPTINNAKEIIFLVTGSSKAHPVKLIFEDSPEASLFPAGRVAPVTGRLSWYLDKAAAGSLNRAKYSG
jgi:6-phosphogluconolactonase